MSVSEVLKGTHTPLSTLSHWEQISELTIECETSSKIIQLYTCMSKTVILIHMSITALYIFSVNKFCFTNLLIGICLDLKGEENNFPVSCS